MGLPSLLITLTAFSILWHIIENWRREVTL